MLLSPRVAYPLTNLLTLTFFRQCSLTNTPTPKSPWLPLRVLRTCSLTGTTAALGVLYDIVLECLLPPPHTTQKIHSKGVRGAPISPNCSFPGVAMPGTFWGQEATSAGAAESGEGTNRKAGNTHKHASEKKIDR